MISHRIASMFAVPFATLIHQLNKKLFNITLLKFVQSRRAPDEQLAVCLAII